MEDSLSSRGSLEELGPGQASGSGGLPATPEPLDVVVAEMDALGADACPADAPAAPLAQAGAPAAARPAAGAPAAAGWRGAVLQQAVERDRHVEGLAQLFEQYSSCLTSMQVLRGGGSCSLCPSPGSGNSPVLGPRAAPAVCRDAELPPPPRDAAADPAAQQPRGGAEEAARQLGERLRLKEQELDALRRLVVEREEELQEKEQAHAEVCRQATRLSRENEELRRRLERSEAERHAEAERRAAELRRAGEPEPAPPGAAGAERCGGGAAARVLPARRRVLRKIHEAELTCIASAGGQGAPLPRGLVAVGTADGYVKLLCSETGRPHAQLSVSKDLPRLVALSLSQATGLLLAAASDSALRLLDLRAHRLLHVLRGHRGALTACGFLGSDNHAFTASADKTVKLWDLETGQPLRSIPASGAVTGAAVDPATGAIAAGHADGSLAVWDPRASGAVSVPAASHRGHSIVGVCMSPDGQSLLSQAEDGSVCTTALGMMRALLALDGLGPVSGPSPPAWSPDGRHLLARGADSVGCWSADTGDEAHVHEAPGTVCVCWERPEAASAHRDGHVALWGAADHARAQG